MDRADAVAKITEALRRREPNAENIDVREDISDFLDSTVYYVDFTSKDYEDQSDAFYYALVEKDGQVKLYDSGIDAIRKFQDLLDKRRNLLQRLGDFQLIEIIAAIIALGVTLVFIYLSITSSPLTTEFIGIFGIIVGYYFGKNVNAARTA